MVEYYEARVLFDYTPAAADELTLRRGESIQVRVGGQEEESWLYGSDPSGCHGVFPANYVAGIRTATSMPAAVHINNKVDNYHGSGGGGDGGGDIPSGVPYQRLGDTAIKYADDAVGTSAATYDAQAAGAVTQQNEPGGLMVAAAADYGDRGDFRDDSAGALWHTSEETTASSAYRAGEEGGAHNGMDTTTYYAHDPHHRNDSSTTIENTLDAPTLHHESIIPAATAAVAVEKGIASGSDDLPDGWFWATDEGSGVVYYYTANGQSSWTRPTASAAAAAAVVEPLVGGEGGGDKMPGGNSGGSSGGGGPSSSRSLLSSAEVSSRAYWVAGVYTWSDSWRQKS